MKDELDIKALRQKINWKQERLARFLGVDRSSVAHMENGRSMSGPVKRLIETLEVAAKAGIADALCPEEEPTP